MPKVEDSKPEAEFSNVKVGVAVSLLLLALLCGLCWYWGFQIGATSLADPDTCWLLAVGRWIAGHYSLPQHDPFSWTASAGPGEGVQYLPYQWLATLIFFGIFKSFGPQGLLLFVSVIVITAFLILPLILARQLGNSLAAQGVRSVLAISAASFHFPLRPELFSYLFISLLVFYIVKTVLGGGAPEVNQGRLIGRQLLLGFLFFAAWANLHSAFVLGLIVLTVLIMACGPRFKSLLAFSCGASIGTLCTPFCFSLYAYLPQLFFSPVNKYNQELLPLQVRELLSFDYLPYLILQIVFVVSLVALTRAHRTGKDDSASHACLSPHLRKAMHGCAFLAAILFISGDMCRRMIPFAVLFSFLHFHLAWHYTFGGNRKPTWLEPFEQVMANAKFYLPALVATALAILVGTNASASIFPLAIPQSTSGFQVPVQALEYIKEHRPDGHLFNDAQYGDLLILALDDKAQVFIDTRFDMYGPTLCLDYYKMANGLQDYRKLIDDYKIDWVFLPRRAPLVRKLQENADWKTDYSDDQALIMSKSGGRQ